MSAHTAGLWAFEARDDQGDFYVTDAENAWVCTLPQSRYVDESIHDPEAEANAHLIAAAPCLLAALDQMVATFSPDNPIGKRTAAYQSARIAIARAKGQS